MRRIDKIILHCSATPEGKPFTVEDIRRWHKGNGWSDIGYHYVVHLDGSVHAGRPESMVGAHCRGYNGSSIGVCYIGGLTKDGRKPKDTRTPAQKTAMEFLVAELMRRYPGATLHGHNEFNPMKACPCFKVGGVSI